MGSGWFISDIELPEAPKTESKSVTRSLLQESVYKSYPAIFQPTTSAYSYTLTGYIYGDIVTQLEQLAKSADTEVVTVIPPTDRLKSTQLSAGVYAVNAFTANRDRYIVTSVNGRTELVYDYTLVLTEFADSGVNENSIELETSSGEEYLGLGAQLGTSVSREAYDFRTILVDTFLTF